MKFTCTSKTGKTNSYVPPVLGNGSLSTQIDFRGEQRQYSYFKMVPGLYRAGRRYDNRSGALFPHGCFFTAADPGRLLSWSETLHCDEAMATASCRYSGNREIHTAAFIHWGGDVLAVRKELVNIDDFKLEYVFGWSLPGELHQHGEARQSRNRRMIPIPPWGMQFSAESTGGRLIINYRIADKRNFRGRLLVVSPTPGASWRIDGNRFELTLPSHSTRLDLLIIPTDMLDSPRKQRRAEEWSHSTFDELLAGHRRIAAAYWRKSSINIPDPKLMSTYCTSLYYLKCCSTRWGIPVGIFPSHWNGTYFGFNNFVQTLCAAGHFQEARKVPEFRRRVLDHAIRRVSSKTSWVGARFAWMSDENDNECTSHGHWCDHIFHLGCIAEEAWRYYQFRPDTSYLRETAYPLLKNCSEYFLKMKIYELKDGRTIVAACTDMERLGAGRRNAFLTTCLVIGTLEWAAQAAEILACDSNDAAVWRDTADRLRRALPSDGHKYLPYPDCDTSSIAVLGGIYPSDVLSEDDPLQLAAVEDFCRRCNEVGNMYRVGGGLCTWYAAFLSIVLLRLGDRRALEFIRLAQQVTGCFAEPFEINEPGRHVGVPWCTEPATCYARAIQELLMTVRGRDIFIGRCLPPEWKSWSFQLFADDDLHVSGQFRSGRLRLRIRAGRLHSGTERVLHSPDGKSQKIQLAPGDSITLCPGETPRADLIRSRGATAAAGRPVRKTTTHCKVQS